MIPDKIPSHPDRALTTSKMRKIIMDKKKRDASSTDHVTIQAAVKAHNDLVWELLNDLQEFDE